MQTLTYAPDQDWKNGDVTGYRRRVVKHFAKRGVLARCVWVAELTMAGRVHYHVIWWLPKKERLPMADARGWWKFGHTNTKGLRSGVGYISKGVGYVAKGSVEGAAAFPQGLRIHGAGGLSRGGRAWRAWQRLPAFVREVWPDRRAQARRFRGEEIRNNGPGFVDEETGEVVRSPWRVVCIRNGAVRMGLVLPKNAAGGVDLAALSEWQLHVWKHSENVADLCDEGEPFNDQP
jgi:hypothetical protein